MRIVCPGRALGLSFHIPGGKAVVQIIDSVTNTCVKFADEYGTWVAVGVLGFVAVGIALRVFTRILGSGGPKQGA